MNERVMQFRIGMFVIVAGLVLTMLIIWFGESPSLFRDRVYVTAHFAEAPGVSEGIPVRKSGIRVGEVVAIRFEDRPRLRGTIAAQGEDGVEVDLGPQGRGFLPKGQFQGELPGVGKAIDVVVSGTEPGGKRRLLTTPDGVLVTLSLERRYKIRAGSVPRISRALIGDVSIDLLPGEGAGLLATADRPTRAPVIEGAVAPDPANALAAATEAFQNVKGTLRSIEEAANGIAAMSKKTGELDLGQLMTSMRTMGDKVGALAGDLDKVLKENRENFGPTLANLRKAGENFNATFDDKTRAHLRATAARLDSGSAQLDKVLADVATPTSARSQPATHLGQALMRFNQIGFDFSLLTGALTTRGRDGRVQLNPNGTLQRLVTDPALYDNYNRLALSARDLLGRFRPALENLGIFADKVARNPSEISRGAFQR